VASVAHFVAAPVFRTCLNPPPWNWDKWNWNQGWNWNRPITVRRSWNWDV